MAVIARRQGAAAGELDGTRFQYFPALDGVRGLAVLAVLANHTGLAIFDGCSDGVDVFFVLSGYLITALLLQEHTRSGRISLPKFYIRRALRLLPALFVFVAVCVLYAGLLSRSSNAENRTIAHETLSGTISVLFYFGNWLRAIHGNNALGLFDHMWSLAIEEQFYLVWPALLLVLLKLRRAWLRVAVVGTMTLASALDHVVLWHGVQSTARIYNGSDTRAVALLLGCLLSILLYQTDRSLAPAIRKMAGIAVWPALILFALLTFSASGASNKFETVYAGTIEAALATIVIAFLVTRQQSLPQWILSKSLIVKIGRISYALYLWHFLIFNAVYEQDPSLRFGLRVIIEISISFVMAVLSFVVVEQPALRLKQRFEPTARTTAVSVPSAVFDTVGNS